MKSIADNDDLGNRAQLVSETPSPRDGVDLRDSILNFLQSQTMLLQYPKSPFH